MRTMDSSQNSISEKQTFHKIQYTGIKVFCVNILRNYNLKVWGWRIAILSNFLVCSLINVLLQLKNDSFLRILIFIKNLTEFDLKSWHSVAKNCKITYLRKKVTPLKNIRHGKSSYFNNQSQILLIFGRIIEYFCKNVH